MLFRSTEEAKFRGITGEILRAYGRQQPTLVGTRSIETSERLSQRVAIGERLQTLAMILVLRTQEELINDPKLGLDYRRMVHGSQSFTHHRPITAGDELSATLHVDGIRAMGGNDMLTVRCEITDSAGDPVTTARAMLVVRGADQ